MEIAISLFGFLLATFCLLKFQPVRDLLKLKNTGNEIDEEVRDFVLAILAPVTLIVILFQYVKTWRNHG